MQVPTTPTNLRTLFRGMAGLSVVCLASCGKDTTEPPATATSIRVTIASTGVDLDPDGYVLTIDNSPGERVTTNASLTRPVSAGGHVVSLTGISSNCLSPQPTPQSVSVAAGNVADVAFSIVCRIRQVAFTSNRSGNGYQIYLMNRDGSNVVQLTTGANDFAGAWSPDGRTLLFTGDDPNGRRQVFGVDADGSNRRQLTTAGVNHSGSYSPDGRSIAFTSDRDTPSLDEIFLMNADGTNQKRLTFSGSAKDNPQWSPDGASFAYTLIPTSLDPAFYFDAYTITVDGSSPRQILTGIADKRSPSWAPDGKSLVLVRRPGPLNDRNQAQVVWSVPTDGSAPRQLTFNTSDGIVPRWSPDGRLLSYSITHGVTSELHVVTQDGTDSRMLPNSTAYDYYSVWRP